MQNESIERITNDTFESGMAFSLHEAKARLQGLQQYIEEMMKEGVDYGQLPKTDKKCLFKSGAEKLCSVYGLAPIYEVMARTQDFETGLFSYEIKVSLVNKATGVIEAEGAGSCNSFEHKYEKQNKYNIANTILKMAKKRAFIDATLLATRSSDIFTQDMEDEPPERDLDRETETRSMNRKVITGNPVMASSKQVSYIFTLISQLKIPMGKMREHIQAYYGKNDCRNLTKDEASEFIKYLRSCEAS